MRSNLFYQMKAKLKEKQTTQSKIVQGLTSESSQSLSLNKQNQNHLFFDCEDLHSSDSMEGNFQNSVNQSNISLSAQLRREANYTIIQIDDENQDAQRDQSLVSSSELTIEEQIKQNLEGLEFTQQNCEEDKSNSYGSETTRKQYLMRQYEKTIAQSFINQGYGVEFIRPYTGKEMKDIRNYKFCLFEIFSKLLKNLFSCIADVEQVKLDLEDRYFRCKLYRQLAICHCWMTKVQKQIFHNLIKRVCGIEFRSFSCKDAYCLFNTIRGKIAELKSILKILLDSPKKQELKLKKIKNIQERERIYQFAVTQLFLIYKNQKMVTQIMNKQYPEGQWNHDKICGVMKTIIQEFIKGVVSKSGKYSKELEFKAIMLNEQDVVTIVNSNMDENFIIWMLHCFKKLNARISKLQLLDTLIRLNDFLSLKGRGNK